MLIDDLVTRVGAPLDNVLRALYQLARTQPFTTFNPGCSATELSEAEQRLGHSLHPLHRFLLTLSDGGTFSCVNSVDWLAAAVAREPTWHWTGPLPQAEGPTFDATAAEGPFEPLIIGESLQRTYDEFSKRRLDLDTFIVIASGFDGEFFGYVRGEPDRIDFVSPDLGRGTRASSFERFIRAQSLQSQYRTSEFIDSVRSAVYSA